MNFGNEITEILVPQSYYPSEHEVPEVLVQVGVPEGKPIVATKLPKMGEKRNWQPSCQNLRENFYK